MQAYLIYFLYWTVQALAFPLLLLYLALRVARNRAYVRHLGERFGFLPQHILPTAPGSIWLHAVSVGEAITAAGLIRRLRTDLPFAPVYVSCSTLAGRAMAEQKLQGLAAAVFYAPLDYRFCVRRILRKLRPSVVVVMETEIWPNLYRDARRSGARLLVVNGRISDKALPRYRRLRWFFRAVLAHPDLIFAQDELAASRYRMLGAERVQDAGNLKYDFDPAATTIAPAVRAWIDKAQPEHVWMAASTMPPATADDPDEDDLVLDAFEELAARFRLQLLILVPRRPERFPEAAAKLEARGIRFRRRSQLPGAEPVDLPAVLLVDTIGELSGLFPLAQCVFMGGTFPNRGGHNILEPAAFGVPVITGPHMENFAEIAADFRAHGAVTTVQEPRNLAREVGAILGDQQASAALGERGRQRSELRCGATARAAEEIRRLYDEALPRPGRFHPFAWLWLGGMAVDRAIKRLGAARPSVPVISIGNLAMGGTGKTPLVLWLCQHLSAAGRNPAVLTRGYRRATADGVVTLKPGDAAGVEQTGEEAQLILRTGHAALAIGADRRAARLDLERKYRPGIYLLDDGFQHWGMRRDLDLVLIDAIDPFRGGVFPHGRLREPFSALRRADAIVITRALPGLRHAGLQREIRRHNAHAPIFLARLEAKLPALPAQARAGAFCGIGQPESFRRTLSDLRVELAFLQIFRDHHHYREEDLEPLAARADFLLTTEKDYLNIPPNLAARLNILAVPVQLVLDEPASLSVLARNCSIQ
ncbi:MAG: tetraacyldisaccharide 4'-kinase [Acidobacteria bacterium]|nr:tetraacyldisaccharide 4'-kinase [Acidobacteriota bacterium]